jgi:hypothetical protein
MPIRVAIAGKQMSAEVAVGLGPPRIVALRQMPGNRLQTASWIEFLARVNDCASAAVAERRAPVAVAPIRIGRPSLDGCSRCRSARHVLHLGGRRCADGCQR